MWKVLYLLTIVGLVAGQEVKNITETQASNTSIPKINLPLNATTTTIAVPNVVLGDKEETVVVNSPINKAAEAGSASNPFDPPELVKLDDDQSLGAFKYYFVILAVSSLSVIGVIIFKALRLRKSRAELKYGKSSNGDKSEFEPLGKANNKWLEESDDENEDEIFDINFLKSSRTNMQA